MAMTHEEFIKDMILRCQEQLKTPDIVTSPTGRAPKLVWTEVLQKRYNRMKEDNHPWYRLVERKATGTIDVDTGFWPTIMYQMTGDVKWVANAWVKIQPFLSSPLNDDNNARQLSMERVLILDWLLPGLTETQIADYKTSLVRMFSNALNDDVRTTDSDQTTGIYFGTAFLQIAFPDIGQQFWDLAQIGGWEATARDRTNLRNSILDYMHMAIGGEWIESDEYNQGTMSLLMMGYAGLGEHRDKFPEITEWIKSGAERTYFMLTPDFLSNFQWGDCQNPSQLRIWPWTTMACMFDDPVARYVVQEMETRHGLETIYSAAPLPKGLLVYDPYAVKEKPTTSLFNSPGQGIITCRKGGSMFCAHFPQNHIAPVDHNVNYGGDFMLYRNGRWVQKHPLSYASYGNDGRAENTMLHCGMGIPIEFRGALEVVDTDEYLFIAGTYGGSFFPSTAYQPPKDFIIEFSRSIVWFKWEVDTIVIFDRSHSLDPRTMPNYAKYSASHRAKMTNAPIRNWRIHMPVLPEANESSASWSINDFEYANIQFIGATLEFDITNQSTEWNNTIKATEKKFHVDWISNIIGFQTMITVGQYGKPVNFAPVVAIPNGVMVGDKKLIFDHTPSSLTPDLTKVRGAWSIS